MKNIRIILTSLLLAVFTMSCESDGGTSNLDLQEGAVPNITKNAELGGILDFYKLEDGEDITIGFSVDLHYGATSSADIVGFYRTVDGDLYGPVTLQAGVTQFPAEITMTIEDIIGAFPELTNREDIQVGDQLIVSTKFYLADGTELNMINNDGSRNYGSDIHTSAFYNAQVTYPVSCPSDLGGTYNVVSSGTNTDGQPAAVNHPYTVTVTDNGGGSYSISDGVAGIYQLWYGVYGYTFETVGNFTDICGDLSGTWNTSFGGDSIELDGTLNEDGTLSIHWTNAFGDEVNAVYTPQ